MANHKQMMEEIFEARALISSIISDILAPDWRIVPPCGPYGWVTSNVVNSRWCAAEIREASQVGQIRVHFGYSKAYYKEILHIADPRFNDKLLKLIQKGWGLCPDHPHYLVSDGLE